MQTAEARYTELASLRDPFLVRARACAALTVPHLMPPDGHNSHTQLPTPYQSVGARGLNNLAVRMLLALLPPNSPFFKLQLDDFVLSKLTGQDDKRAEMEEALSSIERAVQGEVETSAIRVPAFEGIKQLLNAGNVLLHFPNSGGMRAFRLDTYVAKRDPFGNLLEVVVRESVSPSVLPKEVQALVSENNKAGSADPANKTVDLFTYIRRTKENFEVFQEVKGRRVPGSYGTYPLDQLPWFALRFTRIDGEDYGRGYVEQYLGDLKSLEGLNQAIVEGSAAASKVIFLVKPGSSTRARTLSKLPNAGIGEGNAEDVSTVQLEKFNDFRVAFDTIQNIEKRLEFAFLLTSGIQRAGERVTAEEIRRVATDLEVALGGVYALLSQEFQLPLVNLLMRRMERKGRLPKLPKDQIKPSVVTGLEALGRGNDADRLIGFLQTIQPFMATVGPTMKLQNWMKRLAAAQQIDVKDLFKSDEEIAQEKQQAIMQQMAMQLGPNAVNQLGGIARDQASQGAAAPEPPPEQ